MSRACRECGHKNRSKASQCAECGAPLRGRRSRITHNASIALDRLPAAAEPNWLPALIIAAGVIVYFNSFAGVFVLDDVSQIWQNTKIRPPTSLSTILLHDRRPLVTLSLAVNYAVAGGTEDLWGYHLVNLAVHLAAGLTLFGLVCRTLLLRPFRDKYARAAPWLAAAVAVIWVLHPLQTQSVTYLTQRAESMMGLFYLLTFYCCIRAADEKAAPLWHAAAVLACALGMASKAVMVTAPVLVLVFDRMFLADSFRELLRKRWMLCAGLVGTWAVLWGTGVAPGVLSSDIQGSATVGFSFKGCTPLEYALTQPKVIGSLSRTSHLCSSGLFSRKLIGMRST